MPIAPIRVNSPPAARQNEQIATSSAARIARASFNP